MAYWDTSCLLELYVREPGSPLFKTHLDGHAALTTSVIPGLNHVLPSTEKKRLRTFYPAEHNSLWRYSIDTSQPG